MAHILQNTMPEILDGGVNVYQIVLLVVPFQVSFDVHRDPGHQRRGGGDLGIGGPFEQIFWQCACRRGAAG